MRLIVKIGYPPFALVLYGCSRVMAAWDRLNGHPWEPDAPRRH